MLFYDAEIYMRCNGVVTNRKRSNIPPNFFIRKSKRKVPKQFEFGPFLVEISGIEPLTS